ncbi:MAG: SCO family protein [Rhodobacteraceae bacterium]|nr:SCO family protein [Paracoccaceae bacterium]
MSKWTVIAASAAIAIGVGAGAVFLLDPFSQKTCGSAVVAGGKAAIGGPFTLVNHKGETVTDKDIITGPTLIYFGYTFCPDVCPLDTARNAEAIDILEAKGIDVLPVFISIDPERDDPRSLADFVEGVHPRMIGLTGTTDQVKAASKAYKTYFRKNGEGEDYLMDHSTFAYLMGPDGLWEFFKRDQTPEEVADVIACFVDQKS